MLEITYESIEITGKASVFFGFLTFLLWLSKPKRFFLLVGVSAFYLSASFMEALCCLWNPNVHHLVWCLLLFGTAYCFDALRTSQRIEL